MLTAVLRPGVVTVTENDGKQTKIFVSSGTITVNDDSTVQVKANIIVELWFYEITPL